MAPVVFCYIGPIVHGNCAGVSTACQGSNSTNSVAVISAIGIGNQTIGLSLVLSFAIGASHLYGVLAQNSKVTVGVRIIQ